MNVTFKTVLFIYFNASGTNFCEMRCSGQIMESVT